MVYPLVIVRDRNNNPHRCGDSALGRTPGSWFRRGAAAGGTAVMVGTGGGWVAHGASQCLVMVVITGEHP